jgi:predicted  nucleic acid-binding Zn-ribbon protein
VTILEKSEEQRKASETEKKINFISEQLSAVLESNIKIMTMIDDIQKKQTSLFAQQESLQREVSRISAKEKDVMIMLSNIEKDCEDISDKCNDVSNKCDDNLLAIKNIKIYKSVSDF